MQMAIWGVLLAAAVVAWLSLGILIALVLLLAAVILPLPSGTLAQASAYELEKHAQSKQ
jgi:Flp pilus assembly protein TadB